MSAFEIIQTIIGVNLLIATVVGVCISALKKAHQKIGLMEKISPIKLYTKVKKSIEKNTNIRYNLIDEN